MADQPPPNSLSLDTNPFRQIASRILELDLLPRAEHNDSRIVAETSLASIPYLVSNDNWVNGIDQPRLNRLLAAADFNPIAIVSPRPFSHPPAPPSPLLTVTCPRRRRVGSSPICGLI